MDRVQQGKLTTLLKKMFCKCNNPNYLLCGSNNFKLSSLRSQKLIFSKETSPTVQLQRGIVCLLNNFEW